MTTVSHTPSLFQTDMDCKNPVTAMALAGFALLNLLDGIDDMKPSKLFS